MGLNVSKGNMYPWITHTWNIVKGKCLHDCTYCYMKRWGNLRDVRFDTNELNTDLGEGNFIFVGSSCDMFAKDIQNLWIQLTLGRCAEFNNDYLFQTKNPGRINKLKDFFPEKSVICTTIETNRYYPDIMVNAPKPYMRANEINVIRDFDRYVTIEPIMEFDLDEMIHLIKMCHPKQVNIGADSGRNNLPEPHPEKVRTLIMELEKFTKVHLKNNLNRLI